MDNMFAIIVIAILIIFLVVVVYYDCKVCDYSSRDYDDSEIKFYLSKDKYQEGVYVKFLKSIRTKDVRINEGDIVWLERFVNYKQQYLALRSSVVGKYKSTESVDWYYHETYDLSLIHVLKNSEWYVIKLPTGYTDNDLWTITTEDELIESLFDVVS